jgi:hypothetical protein
MEEVGADAVVDGLRKDAKVFAALEADEETAVG